LHPSTLYVVFDVVGIKGTACDILNTILVLINAYLGAQLVALEDF